MLELLSNFTWAFLWGLSMAFPSANGGKRRMLRNNADRGLLSMAREYVCIRIRCLPGHLLRYIDESWNHSEFRWSSVVPAAGGLNSPRS